MKVGEDIAGQKYRKRLRKRRLLIFLIKFAELSVGVRLNVIVNFSLDYVYTVR